MRSKYIWMDGDLVPFEQATVHFLNPTMHYGTGVFEGIRCYETRRGSAVFRLKEHLQRFIDSAHIAGILDYPYSAGELYNAVHLTIRANGFAACYIRPMIYMTGPLTLTLDDWTPATGIAVWEWAPFLGKEAAEKGVRMMVSSFTRHHPNVMMTKAKISGNYVNSTLAKTFARRAGFDEAVMLDPQGYVAECTGENLFIVRDGVIYTPPRTTILEGITRASVITLARDLGYTVVEEPIARDQLYIADEIFVTGTAAELVPVGEVDFRRIGNGRRGPVTQAVQELFHETVRGLGARSHEWLDFVDETVIAC
jgi:branched-chain amino acid aminotransferase